MIIAKKVAAARDMDTVFAIRQKVFVEEQKVPLDEEYDEFEKTASHYMATYNGLPAGVARWRKTDKGVKLERFAVLEEFRSKAVGSHVLKAVLNDVKQQFPEEVVYLHAQLKAIPFYERHGFNKVGEQFSECDIEHFKMVLN